MRSNPITCQKPERQAKVIHMSEDNSLMGKLEALMNKNRQAASASTVARPDSMDDIPVLTELLDEPLPAAASALHMFANDVYIPEPLASLAPLPPPVAIVPLAQTVKAEAAKVSFTAPLQAPPLSDERIRALARQIQDQVMANIQPQLSGPIQEKLLGKIESYVNEALRNALAEIKQEIADTITSAVTDALGA